MDYALILFFIAEAVVELWDEFNRYTIKQISTYITESEQKMGTDGWRTYLAVQNSNMTKNIRKALQKTLLASNSAILDAFNEIIKETLINNKGLEVTDSERLDQYMKLVYKETAGEIKNLTNSMARETTGIFTRACDEAVLLSQTGLKSRSEAIIEAISKTARTGLYLTYPSGHRDRTEVAVRRAVQTGCAQMSGAVTTELCEQNDINYVVVSSHLGARISDDPIADHSGWQGKIYKIRPDDSDYDLLEEATGYNALHPEDSDPLGLYGYNCRHSMTPVPDPDNFKNNNPKWDSEENRRVYEATQKQRAMERGMRDTRRQIAAMEAVRDNATTEETRKNAEEELKRLQRIFEAEQAQYAEFSKEAGLPEQRDRLAI